MPASALYVSPLSVHGDSFLSLSRQALEEAMLKVLRGQFARRDPNSGRLRRTFRMNECSHGVVDREEWFATLRKHKFHSLMTKVRPP